MRDERICKVHTTAATGEEDLREEQALTARRPASCVVLVFCNEASMLSAPRPCAATAPGGLPPASN
eukprot:1161237-Pelagomonas_calceolata.AAC.4